MGSDPLDHNFEGLRAFNTGSGTFSNGDKGDPPGGGDHPSGTSQYVTWEQFTRFMDRFSEGLRRAVEIDLQRLLTESEGRTQSAISSLEKQTAAACERIETSKATLDGKIGQLTEHFDGKLGQIVERIESIKRSFGDRAWVLSAGILLLYGILTFLAGKYFAK